jgi:superfamily I DNA/RNA helicase
MVGRVDFVNVHAFASQLLKERGIAFRIDGLEAQRAFADAWNPIGASSPLRAPRFTRRYWEEEIAHVIKGRGLLLHALVGDRPDGLTLIGDGQQTIYPGGYTLGEVGISLAGRGVVLDVNHRNTAEVLDFAKQMVADDQFVDIEGVDGAGDTVSAVTRSGPEPSVHRFADRAEHDAALLARVDEVLHLVGTGRGDVGILTATNPQADKVAAVLDAAGVPSVSLKHYAGTSSDMVRVGTIKRAKGLEFKQVLLPHVPAKLLVDAPDTESVAARERRELDRRELYVGMTRARDGLWVGALGRA